MASTRDRLNKIKSGVFSRGLAMARVTVAAGTEAAAHALTGWIGNEDERARKLKELLISQASRLTTELGQLKGSLMKMGQMLSMLGEHFLPPEANQILKSLQSQSPPLAWAEIHKQLRAELGDERLAELEIETDPAASASLGQVHRARRKSDGLRIALKVQYPGVDTAIDSDLKTLRTLLSLANFLPKDRDVDSLFEEVRQMLHRETDYVKERETTEEFARFFAQDRRVRIPRVVSEFCTQRVMATEWMDGVAVDSPEVAALSQERRNALAATFLEMYWREIFVCGAVQSDPHFGNYRIQIAPEGSAVGEPDRLVCFDFGAVRKFEPNFLEPYRELVLGSFLKDRMRIEAASRRLAFLREEDSAEIVNRFVDFCILMAEPFHADAEYDWGSSDLPTRVARAVPGMALILKFRTPPREIVFNDRKLGGVYIFVSTLKARMNSRALLSAFVDSLEERL